MAKMMYFHVPEDQALLAAFGEVALRHEHLSHVLRMTIKTLTGVSVNEALDATARDGARELRERVTKLAKQRLGEGKALVQLQAIIERSKRATDLRNSYVHSVWAQELDGEPMRRDGTQQWHPLPAVEQLHELSRELLTLTNELNSARLEGFLSEALAKARR